MVFKTIEAEIWTPQNAGDSVEGVLIKSQSDVGPQNVMLYHLEVKGEPVNVWGSMILDQWMIYVKPGDLIRIIYNGLGEKQPGKNAAKLFDVQIDKD